MQKGEKFYLHNHVRIFGLGVVSFMQGDDGNIYVALDILQSYRQSGGVRFGIPKLKPSKRMEIREWRFIHTNPHDRCLDTGYLGIDLQVFM